MKTLKSHLIDSLKNHSFKEIYNDEKELLDVSLQLLETRKKAGITQKELAQVANLTQQQISKVESGANCNIMTYLKAGRAIGLKFHLNKISTKKQLT